LIRLPHPAGENPDTPDPPSTDGSGDQSGAEAQTFVLGTCGPLTGGYAIYGQAVVNGAELAVEEINASDSAASDGSSIGSFAAMA